MSDKKPVLEKLKETAANAVYLAAGAAEKTSEAINNTKDKIIAVVDQSGNGQIDAEDFIILGLKMPGVRIDRANFLRKELSNKCLESVVNQAIATNPMKAGIDVELIDSVADAVIEYERKHVTGIAAALGVPGGAAMIATIPADLTQYYGHLLRTTQKLLYLYGFPEVDFNSDGQVLDTATMNTLIICMGIMYGAAGANNAIKAMAKALGVGVEKKLLNTALTKGTIYPLVKSVAKWFGQKMTKEIFAGFFKKAIPVVGGVVGGGLTYVSFKPCCDRLKDSLRDTMLSNPNHVSSEAENLMLNNILDGKVIDVSPEEISKVEVEE